MDRSRLSAAGQLALSLVAVLAAVAACANPVAQRVSAGPATAAASSTNPARTQPSAQATASACPDHPDDLTASMAEGAFAAVVRYNRKDPTFKPGLLRRDSIRLAPRADARGEQVAVECGAAVAARTFVVMTTRTDLLPSQSLSQGVYFVSRVSGLFVVWLQAH